MSETSGAPGAADRTPPKQKARELARHLRGERPDYAYLKQVFRHLRPELEIEIHGSPSACRMCRARRRCAATIRSCGRRGTSATWS